jgi:hypothetical protein
MLVFNSRNESAYIEISALFCSGQSLLFFIKNKGGYYIITKLINHYFLKKLSE